MWRPDDWDTSVIREDNEWCCGAEDVTCWIEAGADAILEALKKKGARLEGYNLQTPVGSTLPVNQADIPFILDTNLGDGWLVFIPEGGHEGENPL